VAGDWYGTNSISQVLKKLNLKYKPFEDFEICVFNDGIFFKSDVINHGTEVYKLIKKISFNFDSDESSEEEVNDSYFEQTRGRGNQSGGSEDHKEPIVICKSSHSGGSKSEQPYHEDQERI